MITLLDEDLGDPPFTGEGERPTQAERDALVGGPEVEWPNARNQADPEAKP